MSGTHRSFDRELNRELHMPPCAHGKYVRCVDRTDEHRDARCEHGVSSEAEPGRQVPARSHPSDVSLLDRSDSVGVISDKQQDGDCRSPDISRPLWICGSGSDGLGSDWRCAAGERRVREADVRRGLTVCA